MNSCYWLTECGLMDTGFFTPAILVSFPTQKRETYGKNDGKALEPMERKPSRTLLAYFAAVKFQCLKRKSPSTEDRKGEMYWEIKMTVETQFYGFFAIQFYSDVYLSHTCIHICIHLYTHVTHIYLYMHTFISMHAIYYRINILNPKKIFGTQASLILKPLHMYN